ncbi:MAG: hypothetical protein LBD23_00115 [Oscillospiraceae bacterium]|jgi:hypothetical protein|nr:hypothetical protein [Oscillospiraceae bacterium]
MLADYEKETDGEFIIIETSNPLIRIFNDNQIWFHLNKDNQYTTFESMTDDELREYINYAIEFIKRRGEKLSDD